LQVISSSATSGAERHVYTLSRQLIDRGHQVQVMVPTPGWLPTVLEDASVPVHTGAMKGREWYQTTRFLLRHVRRNKVDVIHTHLTRAAYLAYAAGMFARVPIVHSVHITNNDVIYRRLAKRRNRLVAVSNFVAGMLHGQGIDKQRIDTVYNGTDFVDFAPAQPEMVKQELGIPSERRLVGLVGRVCREKGHLEMVQAMSAVTREHPDAHVVFVGRIEEQFAPEVAGAIADAGLRDRVTMTGVRHDVARLLDSFTIAAMPSHMETFGVAAIEAMARGKAVVASRVGGLPEVVRHGQSGILVDLRPEELAEAVSYLFTNHDERERMGQNGRMIVEQKFTLPQMARQFELVYEKTLSPS
jgi:glycosyltransferase involved in cell wall biosynthesis